MRPTTTPTPHTTRLQGYKAFSLAVYADAIDCAVLGCYGPDRTTLRAIRISSFSMFPVITFLSRSSTDSGRYAATQRYSRAQDLQRERTIPSRILQKCRRASLSATERERGGEREMEKVSISALIGLRSLRHFWATLGGRSGLGVFGFLGRVEDLAVILSERTVASFVLAFCNISKICGPSSRRIRQRRASTMTSVSKRNLAARKQS
jgi:hypothetical protein